MGITQEAVNNFFKPRVKPKAKTEPAVGAKRSPPESPAPEAKKAKEQREPVEEQKDEDMKEAKEEQTKEPVKETKETKEESKDVVMGEVSKAKDDSMLQAGKPIPYKALTDTFEKVEATTKRLEINSILTAFFIDVLNTNPKDLPLITYLFINRLGPDYEGLELGLGESIIIKALAEATGRNIGQVKNHYHKAGDLGTVAMDLRKTQGIMFMPKPLNVTGVFNSLTEIAKSTGQASQNKKIDIIKRLLTASKGTEAKFIVRSLEGKLRIGVAEKSILTSLAQAFVAWEGQQKGVKPTSDEVSKVEEMLRDVHCQLPNYEIIINAVIDHGLANLQENCKLEPGVPLKPMLAKPTKSITEVLDRFSGERFTCEYKYDGERAQVHRTPDGKYNVYSRNSEDMSQRYPDIVSIAPRFANESVSSFVIDCEAVAWDREQGKILPFQVLSTRKRKDVEEDKITVRICLFVFDILYINGQSLLQKSLQERRDILRQNFQSVEGEFAYAKSMDTDNVEEIQAFLDQSVKDGCEGLMVKVLDGAESGYEPSKRSRNWLKLKKDYLEGVGDTLDLVVLGAYYGRGKRTNWYGGFLLGSYNADSEEYETVCKIGTGFSEADLEKFHDQLKDTVVKDKKSYISHSDASNQQPDVWFEPKYVWEVLTADLSLSPVYKAGMQEMGKGISLRFPRFMRVREDKGPEQATTSEQIVEFYQRQTHN